MMTETFLARMGLFDARAPRYTSYPTAPHFSPSIGASDYSRWLGDIPAGSAVSLYVHVPFCRRLCWFCACRTQGSQTLSPVAAYVDTLLAELSLLAAQLPDGVTLSRLHWGGGTPTLLSPELIEKLSDAIFAVLPRGENAEFSVEIDPNELDEPRLRALAAAGMNRASIGVQDFDPKIQQAIGREQSFEITRDAVDMLRDCGVHSLNADILYGLPHQTIPGIAASVEKLIGLNPDRVALYGYAHVPWVAKRQQLIPTDALPTPIERLRLFNRAQQLFEAAGYRDVGIDHFARPGDGLDRAARDGTLHRNFQGYTDDTAEVLIGMGASSISRFPQGYAQNAPSTSAYAREVQAGRFATTRGHRFAGDDLLRARVIEALMCYFRVSAADLDMRFGLNEDAAAALFAPVLRDFPEALEMHRGDLVLTDAGRPLARVIARAFDAYEMAESSYSLAI